MSLKPLLDVDAILKKVLDNHLKSEEKAKTKAKTKAKAKIKSEAKPKKVITLGKRLCYLRIKEAYATTGLQPCRAEYWFYESRKKSLIQISILSDDRECATPIAAYTLMKRKKLLESDKPPRFITDYYNLDKPSNQWSYGRMAQISGLSIGYIMGFRAGYDNNTIKLRNQSTDYCHGYEDGLTIRTFMIKDTLIDPDPVYDIYADETDDDILLELYRVRGYWRSSWEKED